MVGDQRVGAALAPHRVVSVTLCVDVDGVGEEAGDVRGLELGEGAGQPVEAVGRDDDVGVGGDRDVDGTVELHEAVRVGRRHPGHLVAVCEDLNGHHINLRQRLHLELEADQPLGTGNRRLAERRTVGREAGEGAGADHHLAAEHRVDQHLVIEGRDIVGRRSEVGAGRTARDGRMDIGHTDAGDGVAMVKKGEPVVPEAALARVGGVVPDTAVVVHDLDRVEVPAPELGVGRVAEQGGVGQVGAAGDAIVFDHAHPAAADAGVVEADHLGAAVARRLEEAGHVFVAPVHRLAARSGLGDAVGEGVGVGVLREGGRDLLAEHGAHPGVEPVVGKGARPGHDGLVVGRDAHLHILGCQRDGAVGDGDRRVGARAAVDMTVHGEEAGGVEQPAQGEAQFGAVSGDRERLFDDLIFKAAGHSDRVVTHREGEVARRRPRKGLGHHGVALPEGDTGRHGGARLVADVDTDRAAVAEDKVDRAGPARQVEGLREAATLCNAAEPARLDAELGDFAGEGALVVGPEAADGEPGAGAVPHLDHNLDGARAHPCAVDRPDRDGLSRPAGTRVGARQVGLQRHDRGVQAVGADGEEEGVCPVGAGRNRGTAQELVDVHQRVDARDGDEAGLGIEHADRQRMVPRDRAEPGHADRHADAADA